MKKILPFLLFCLIVNSSFARRIDAGTHFSDKKNVYYTLDHSDYLREWSISPEVNPDILRIYCDKPIIVTFFLKSEEFEFTVNQNDTINFAIILKGKDTAYTQVIGVKEIPNTIKTEDKLYHLSRLWSEAKYNFVNIDQIRFDWDSLYYAYIPQIMKSENDYAYFRLLKKFYASLNDGHTEVGKPSSLSVYCDYIPITISAFDKQLYITGFSKNSSIDSSFLGAKIIEIEQIPTLQYIDEEVLPYISASTEQSKWMQVPAVLGYDLRIKKFNALVLKKSGEKVSISISRNGEATRTKEEGESLVPPKNISWDLVQLEWLQDSILHLSINGFYPEEIVIPQLKQMEPQILKAKRLIIDLRGNGGGTTGVAWVLQSYLTKGNFLINYAWQTRINDGVRRANGNWIEECQDFYMDRAYRTEKGDTIPISDTIIRWTMPTVILIGEYTFSAAEDFLVNIYEVPDRPLLIGSESGGSTGSPLVIENLPLDSRARVCTRRILYPYSLKPFVNKGVTPDIIVETSFEDFCSGKDIVLQKGIETVSKISKLAN
ncbi:MAG TPA: S41 family peptidase [Bacteroidales bacterium]|nr:S41 family peptidase [Bacteroidales bacterium]